MWSCAGRGGASVYRPLQAGAGDGPLAHLVGLVDQVLHGLDPRLGLCPPAPMFVPQGLGVECFLHEDLGGGFKVTDPCLGLVCAGVGLDPLLLRQAGRAEKPVPIRLGLVELVEEGEEVARGEVDRRVGLLCVVCDCS